MERGETSNIILVVVGASVAVLVAVSVFFALRAPTQLDPNSPEGTAQGYFQAIEDRDEDLATSFLTEDLQEFCDGEWQYRDFESANRVVITDTKIDGDTATVSVTITVSYGDDPFGGGSYDQDESIKMARVGDVWLISKLTWPMDAYPCNKEDG
ncbi:MAG: hypothetical protein M3112_07160 [Actinomycetia bacterium]|nr:hypothetical protein [Actinomycetes bacterium]